MVIISRDNKRKVLGSMQLRVFLVMLLIGIAPVYISSFVLLNSYKTQAIVNRVTELQDRCNIISNLLISYGYFSATEGIDLSDVDAEIMQVSEGYHGRIVIVDKNFNIVKDTYGLEEGKTIISEQVISCSRGNASIYVDNKSQYVELVNPVVNTTTKETAGVIIMSFSTKNIFAVYEALRQKISVLSIIIAIVVVLISYLYSRVVSKPFAKITGIIDHATEGYLEEQVSIKGYYEVQKIADSFNHLLTRLQTLEQSRQEFVSNVSHELKTPITSMKVLSDSLLSQENAPADLYREFMVDIAAEIEREDKIINDLLSLVRLDKRSGEPNISQVNINDLMEQILKRLRPIAAKRNIELVYESFRPVLADVDEVKLSLAINNLIENAIKYNFDDGWVRVSLNADHKFFYVSVSDSGVGIPEEFQDRIFERFYRVDKARSRETGGTGLGLSITKSVVLMHRGAIKVYSKEKEGTTFTIRIPLNYIA